MAHRNLPEVWHEKKSLYKPNRMDQIFEHFLSQHFFSEPLLRAEFTPLCDCDETDSNYLLNFDLPGVKNNDVKVEIKDNQLSVSGERKSESKNKEGYEKSYGSFYRSFTLPSNIDSDKIEAHFENGVLKVSIPKKEKSSGKQIPVKSK
jgi:HSP20 family protein